MDNSIYSWATRLYPEAKFWLSLGGALWAIFKVKTKVTEWFKVLKHNDLHHIQESINETNEELKSQTAAIVSLHKESTDRIVDELKELRADFRAKL